MLARMHNIFFVCIVYVFLHLYAHRHKQVRSLFWKQIESFSRRSKLETCIDFRSVDRKSCDCSDRQHFLRYKFQAHHDKFQSFKDNTNKVLRR